jgi:hydroxymethylbilane synthase
VAALLARQGVDAELVPMETSGDRGAHPSTSPAGIKGLFVAEIVRALQAGEVDLAVHSAKDLPSEDPEGVVVAAVPERVSPYDVLITRTGRLRRKGDKVGSSSLRRRGQLLRSRPHLEVVDIRGNVDTRIRKVADGEYDAVILARAGLSRLGRLDEATEVLDPIQMLPAPGQGALAVECRADLVDTLAVLDDPHTRAQVTAERAVLSTLEAGCSAPVGALAEIAESEDGEELWIRAVVLSADGALAVRKSLSGKPADAEAIGRRLATDMLEDGANELEGGAAP